MAALAPRWGRAEHGLRAEGCRRSASGVGRPHTTAADERCGTRDQLPERSHRARRSLCEQWLAAGTAQADYQIDMGQRRPGQPRDRETSEPRRLTCRTGGEHGQIVSDVVELKYRSRSVRGALFVVVGHPDECVTVHLGYGRTRAGHLGTGAGFNANAIRTADALWSGDRPRSRRHRRQQFARVHAVSPPDGRSRDGARRHAGRVRSRSDVSPAG